MSVIIKGFAILVTSMFVTVMWLDMLDDIRINVKAKLDKRKQDKTNDPIESWKKAEAVERKPGTGGVCASSVSRRTAPGEQTILYPFKSELTKTCKKNERGVEK